MSIDNTSMMEIYPYGGILAYLKYHYIDGFMKQTVMLINKSRIDYSKDKDGKKIAVASQPKSDKEVKDMLSRFNIGQ